MHSILSKTKRVKERKGGGRAHNIIYTKSGNAVLTDYSIKGQQYIGNINYYYTTQCIADV